MESVDTVEVGHRAVFSRQNMPDVFQEKIGHSRDFVGRHVVLMQNADKFTTFILLALLASFFDAFLHTFLEKGTSPGHVHQIDQTLNPSQALHDAHFTRVFVFVQKK